MCPWNRGKPRACLAELHPQTQKTEKEPNPIGGTSVARARNAENRGLPARWKFYHEAYYFQVPPGQEPAWDNRKTFRLGGTLPEAYKEWAKRIEATFNATTIGALLERYQLEVIPTKAPSTQRQNLIALKQLRLVFADMNVDDIIPRHVYLYVDKRSAKTSAHKEMEALSHAYTKAVEGGYIDRHPFLGRVALKGEKPRTCYIEDWEIIDCAHTTPADWQYLGRACLHSGQAADRDASWGFIATDDGRPDGRWHSYHTAEDGRQNWKTVNH
jgi:hypothetical protein